VIVAAKSLPSSYNLPAQQFRFVGSTTAVAGNIQSQDNTRNKYLPPGWGLYFLTEPQIAAATTLSAATYTETQ
jgi:hypothetical protein